MYSFIIYFLQLLFPVFIYMYSVFQKKLGWITLLIILSSFFDAQCICWPNFGTLFLNFEFVTLQSKHNSMKKLRFWNTRKCFYKATLEATPSLSQTRNFNHSKCWKFLVCKIFYKHFFKTSKDSEIFMMHCIEIRFTLGYFSKTKLWYTVDSLINGHAN